MLKWKLRRTSIEPKKDKPACRHRQKNKNALSKLSGVLPQLPAISPFIFFFTLTKSIRTVGHQKNKQKLLKIPPVYYANVNGFNVHNFVIEQRKNFQTFTVSIYFITP